MKLKNKFVLLLILQLGNIYPVVMSLSLFAQGNKKILIIGNQHATNREGQIVEDDTVESAIVFNWIQNLNERVCFLLEYFDGKNKKTSSISNNYRGLCSQLPHWARNNNYKYNNLSFIFADVRSEKFSLIHNVTQQVLKTNKSKVSSEFDITIADFFNEIEEIKTKLEQKIVRAPQYLLNIYIILQEYYKFVQNFLAKFDKNSSLIEVTINSLFLNFNKFRSFYRTYMDLGCYLADLGFVFSIIEALEKWDNIVLYTGNEHAKAVIWYLRTCGYTELWCNGIWERTNNYEGRVFESAELEQYLNAAFNKNLCPNCKLKEAVWRCGVCKNIYYCSIGCQKEDWKNHNLNCKKK